MIEIDFICRAKNDALRVSVALDLVLILVILQYNLYELFGVTGAKDIDSKVVSFTEIPAISLWHGLEISYFPQSYNYFLLE